MDGKCSSEKAHPVFENRNLIYALILILLVSAVFSGILSSDFIEAYDDEEYVTRNPVVAGGLTLQGIQWSFSSFVRCSWNPVTWWSHMLDVQLFGMNPSGHHLTSLLIHLTNTLLIYTLFLRMTGRDGCSFVIAALFAVHPLHVESVAWISERKDLLSAMFGLSALHCYLSFARSGRFAAYLMMFVFFCLGLMSKPMIVTLPFVMLLMDWWPLGRGEGDTGHGTRYLIREKLPLLIPAAAVSAVTLMVQRQTGAVVPLSVTPLTERIMSAADAYMTYCLKFLAPLNLAMMYPYREVPAWRFAAAALFLSGVTVAAWRMRRTKAWFLFGWFWFLGTLIPVIGLVRVGPQAYADRYTYIPLVGLALIAVRGAGDLFSSLRTGVAARYAGAAAITVLGVLSYIQCGYWKDAPTLYQRAIDVTEGNHTAHNNMGVVLSRRGRYREAVQHLEKAVALDPAFYGSHYNLGIALAKSGERGEAKKHFREAIRLMPTRPESYIELAQLLWDEHDIHGARTVVLEGLRHVPGDPLLLANRTLLDDEAAAATAVRK